MNEAEFKAKNKRIALHVIQLVDGLPRGVANDAIARQIIRSATSIGANYRAGCRGRSDREMASKFNIALEEADETQYWLELLADSGHAERGSVRKVYDEVDEVLRMLVASLKTLRQ
jgi:four helix bundle protein